jgi:hypothetical protein
MTLFGQACCATASFNGFFSPHRVYRCLAFQTNSSSACDCSSCFFFYCFTACLWSFGFITGIYLQWEYSTFVDSFPFLIFASLRVELFTCGCSLSVKCKTVKVKSVIKYVCGIRFAHILEGLQWILSSDPLVTLTSRDLWVVLSHFLWARWSLTWAWLPLLLLTTPPAPKKALDYPVQVGILRPAPYYCELDRWMLGSILTSVIHVWFMCESSVIHVRKDVPLPIAHLVN